MKTEKEFLKKKEYPIHNIGIMKIPHISLNNAIEAMEEYAQLTRPTVSEEEITYEAFKSVFMFIHQEAVAVDLNEAELRQEWGIFKAAIKELLNR